MKAALLLLAIATIATFSAPVTAQTAAAAPSATLKAELTHGIDARKARVGDPVLARCLSNLLSRGEIRIPKNAKVIGHVTEVQRKTRGNGESTLGIVFDRAVMRDGREVRLTAATIQAIAPPAMMAHESDESTFGGAPSPDSASRTPGAIGLNTTASAQAQTSATANGPLHNVSVTTAPGNSRLRTNATGVIGLKGLELDTAASSAASGSVIRSSSQNVRLESGTRLILRVRVQ